MNSRDGESGKSLHEVVMAVGMSSETKWGKPLEVKSRAPAAAYRRAAGCEHCCSHWPPHFQSVPQGLAKGPGWLRGGAREGEGGGAEAVMKARIPCDNTCPRTGVCNLLSQGGGGSNVISHPRVRPLLGANLGQAAGPSELNLYCLPEGLRGDQASVMIVWGFGM